jgi:DNA polymerase-4
MDAFYVAVELRRAPELRGRPVVVAGRGPRAVVTTASYEARRHGVGSAMPAARARQLCPEAIFLTPDFQYYRAASREVMAIVRANVDQVEVVGLDEAYLELTGLPAPKAGMRRLVAEILARTGLHASVGIGPNKLVAKVASDAEKPRGFVVLTREQACARFAEAPCGLIPGIGARSVERLRGLGIRTVGELARAPERVLADGFPGRIGLGLKRLARFEHDGAVTEVRKVVSESRELTFDVDVSDPAVLREALERQVRELSAALVRQGREGRTVGIKVRLHDFSTHTRARTLTVPVCGVGQIGPLALALLEAFLAEHPDRPVRLLGVRVAGLTEAEEPAQLALAV